MTLGDKDREISLINDKLSTYKDAADKKGKVDEKVGASMCVCACVRVHVYACG
jgi:hypothetical protein